MEKIKFSTIKINLSEDILDHDPLKIYLLINYYNDNINSSG